MIGPDTLRTERLVLRRPTEEDRAFWVRLHRDPALYTHAPWAMAESDEVASAWFDGVLATWAEQGFGYHVAQDADSGSPLGVGGLRPQDGGELNLAYRFSVESHGQGLAREAARSWVAHGLEWHAGTPVRALVRPHNTPSVRTAESSGLERVGEHDDVTGEPPSLVLASPRSAAVGAEGFSARERTEALDLWEVTTRMGGAVGFVPDAARERIEAALNAHAEQMSRGEAVAVTLRSAADHRLLGLGWWVSSTNPLLAHRRTAYRVMTEPSRRGRNLGRLLMAAMHRVARQSGAELVDLGVRGGTGTEEFYRRCGYAEVGRLPGGVRVASGDDRDDIWMARRLD
ncbi:MAG: GNAT family N-acetyltransferase [Tetrasphaera sp.]|nr:GNAT family N-acetyltransferase [Tetrasphaera sp.]